MTADVDTDNQADDGSFRWEVPSTFNFSADVIDRWAEDPDRLALITVDQAGLEQRFTYARASCSARGARERRCCSTTARSSRPSGSACSNDSRSLAFVPPLPSCPQEVENALARHAVVQECAVVGIPDEERGQIVKAWIVLADGHVGNDDLVTELQTHTKETTAPYKYPRAIAFTDELPKTVTGKIRRNILRERT